MGKDSTSLLGFFGISDPLRRLERELKSPKALATNDLRGLNRRLRAMRADIDKLAASATSALYARAGGHEIDKKPDQCDWAERSGPWRSPLAQRGHVDFPSPLGLGAGVTLFHDATRADISLRQETNPDTSGAATFGLVFDVYRFDGSFLSLVQDLPPAALDGLSLGHFFRVQLQVQREQPIEIYARLNIQHGPNHEQIVRQFSFDGDHALAEFDLAYTKVNERRIEKAWLDLIFEGPEMNRIAIWDMVMLRAPRADI